MASKEDDITAPQELLEYAPTLPAITLTPLSTTPGIRRSISNSSSNPGLSRTPSPSSPSSSIDTAISSPTSVSCRPSESWSSFYYTWKDSYDASRLMPPPLSYYTRNASSTLSGETTNAGGNNAFDSFQSLRISDMSHYSHPINSPPREEHVLKCDECSRSFRKDIHLERHLRIHSKAKPFTCSGCDKGFSRKDHLKVQPS
ncbi:hypothetical protein F4779DRAFT_40719 [Xylariaceae sp. FL0662B]|nr:hypothetical protein F4779DRAFT_40719 [Xylariaceae sp. FL0662B]